MTEKTHVCKETHSQVMVHVFYQHLRCRGREIPEFTVSGLKFEFQDTQSNTQKYCLENNTNNFK